MNSRDQIRQMESEGFEVRCDQLKDGRYRVRVERHSGRTFPDYRAATTSTSAMEHAVHAAFHKWETAKAAGEIQEPYIIRKQVIA